MGRQQHIIVDGIAPSDHDTCLPPTLCYHMKVLCLHVCLHVLFILQWPNVLFILQWPTVKYNTSQFTHPLKTPICFGKRKDRESNLRRFMSDCNAVTLLTTYNSCFSCFCWLGESCWLWLEGLWAICPSDKWQCKRQCTVLENIFASLTKLRNWSQPL